MHRQEKTKQRVHEYVHWVYCFAVQFWLAIKITLDFCQEIVFTKKRTPILRKVTLEVSEQAKLKNKTLTIIISCNFEYLKYKSFIFGQHFCIYVVHINMTIVILNIHAQLNKINWWLPQRFRVMRKWANKTTMSSNYDNILNRWQN